MKLLKKLLKTLGIIVGCLVLVVLIYVGYVVVSYHRIGDMDLAVTKVQKEVVTLDEDYTLFSWNIGFGAYEEDYGFFMDGGTESWAFSKERLLENMDEITAFAKSYDADFYFFQEVDTDSTRAYHVNEEEIICATLTDYNKTFSKNYESPFLFYPLTQPHGASNSGLLTFSRYLIDSARRIEVPIEKGFSKFFDLDRCYSKNILPLENGKKLILYNLHLSAYTKDGTITNEQLNMLISDMKQEVENGNYCIAGGDFNKDLIGNSNQVFGNSENAEDVWAKPLPDGLFDNTSLSLVASINKDAPIASCRNADGPYTEEQSKYLIDGFIVSNNILAISYEVIDTKFKYSDHNPVMLRFKLN